MKRRVAEDGVEQRHPVIQSVIDSNDDKIKKALKSGYRVYYDADTSIMTVRGPRGTQTTIKIRHTRRHPQGICKLLSMAIQELINEDVLVCGKSLSDVLAEQIKAME